MSRFSNLEFEDEPGEHSQSGNVIKDESYYLTEARQAWESGEFEQALRAYARALEHNPQNAAAWTGQVRMLIELNEAREARLWADKALEKFPHEPDLLAAKAVALGRSGDLDGALAFSDAAVEERGDSPYVWLARADVLLARKEKLADFCFEKALFQAAGNWAWHWCAARIRCFYKQFALALKHAQDALNLDATRAVIWLQLGLCQQALGLTAAGSSFAQALELNPRCLEARKARLAQENAGGWSRLRNSFRRLF